MKHHLVIIYHSLNDPIFKGLMLKYLQQFQREGKGKHFFHLITFEQETYKLSAKEVKIKQVELRENHQINWSPINYHSGGFFIIIKKIWDLFLLLRMSFFIKKKNSLYRIIGFTTIAGGLSYVVSKLLKIPLVLLNIEPHSDYMADFSFWSRSSSSYRILHWLENRQLTYAKYVAVPTQNAYQELSQQYPNRTNLHFVPTCIDISDFSFDRKGRKEIRKELNLTDETTVLVYLGKFGGIYYTIEQMAETCQKLLNNNNDVFFYIITSDDIEEVNSVFKKHNLMDNYYIKHKIPYEDISKHLSAADLGLLFVPSYKSQLYRCPIKTANYLACGLPYLITDNIGDDSRLAEELNLGLVLNNNAITNLNHILKAKKYDKKTLRKTVSEIRGIHLVIDYFKMALN